MKVNIDLLDKLNYRDGKQLLESHNYHQGYINYDNTGTADIHDEYFFLEDNKRGIIIDTISNVRVYRKNEEKPYKQYWSRTK